MNVIPLFHRTLQSSSSRARGRGSMECDVCMQHFDSAERRPKVLLCGHTYCLSCLRQLATKKCPVDEKAFQLDALADNFKLLSATHRPTRFWCVSCEKEATEHCVSEHDIRSLKKQRTAAAEHHLEALRQGEEALAALGGMLDEATVIRQMEDCSDTLQRE
ncbi:roquin-1-like [Thrips palmi]|uniref:Roquin-1-like n=1 Tax=Thrips palmi TaxID=161013 RepID=A0A6P8YH80_THRPL|nr:roquin-1-like [Thrips palmi]